MPHPAIAPGHTAVITGAASGIGLAAAGILSGLGLNVLMADRNEAALRAAAAGLASNRVRAEKVDVARPEDLRRLAEVAAETFGPVHVLMNNAGIEPKTGKPWEDAAGWRDVLEVNLWGVINGVQALVPGMLAHGAPAVVVNTGSKQGITLPPVNPAYNVSKAALKAYTELLAHELRNAAPQVSAHLLIPGFTYTGLTNKPAKPDGAWTGEQVVQVMLAGLERGDFYLFCQDNETPREVDEKRMAWAIGDIIENRPALSRWHPDWKDRFAAYMRG